MVSVRCAGVTRAVPLVHVSTVERGSGVAGMRLSGGFEVVSHNVTVDLPDGRVVSISSSGTVEVYAERFDRSGLSINRYRVELPTFVEVAELCDPDGDGTFKIEGHHAH